MNSGNTDGGPGHAVLVDQLAQTLAAAGQLIAGVHGEQWAARTPCPEWTVRDLVNHVVGGNRLFAMVLSGQPLPPPEEMAHRRGVDQLGGDPVAAFQDASAQLLAAARAPKIAERDFSTPIGQVPGTTVLHLRITELLVHGWDLARATGQSAQFSGDVAEQELAFTRGSLSHVPPRPGPRPFGSPQPAPQDATPLDRLAALLGRVLSWPDQATG